MRDSVQPNDLIFAKGYGFCLLLKKLEKILVRIQIKFRITNIVEVC